MATSFHCEEMTCLCACWLSRCLIPITKSWLYSLISFRDFSMLWNQRSATFTCSGFVCFFIADHTSAIVSAWLGTAAGSGFFAGTLSWLSVMVLLVYWYIPRLFCPMPEEERLPRVYLVLGPLPRRFLKQSCGHMQSSRPRNCMTIWKKTFWNQRRHVTNFLDTFASDKMCPYVSSIAIFNIFIL